MKILLKILSKSQKKNLILILCLMIIISLLEFLSIGAVLPLLDIIFNGSVINNRNSNFIINFLDINKDLIIILLFLIFLHSYLKIFSF